MFKNKEIKTLILTEIMVAIISVIGFIVLNNCIYITYKRELISNNAYIVNSILEKHPELENDVINSLLHNNLDYKDSKKVIEKYGLNDVKSLDFINDNASKKNSILVITIIYVMIIFIIMIIVLGIFINKFYKKIRTLSKYTDDVLNNRYSMDIREYDEGDISNLKNDLYKMTIKLREQSEISIRDKKDLEETLSDISHQLKTPLTSMYVINELLYDNKI
ncbi:MAG TPA: hypothetical protein PLV83_02950 [Bacilli bacterium]|nr:hypothetical protein [Bacilli bacterium]